MLFTALPLTILLSGTIAQATSLWKARNNYPSPDDKCTSPITIETTTPVQLPDVVLSSTEAVPPILQNTTLPTPESGNTTIYTPNGGEIVVPVNKTSGSPDNGDVSQVILTPDNSSVTVGITRNTSTEFFRPETYVNAPDVQQDDTTVAFSFTGTTDYLGALSDPERQPSFPDKGGCTYEYKSVLGGSNGSVPAEGGLWALEGYVWLTPGNVRQKSIGDCGMGSAVEASSLPCSAPSFSTAGSEYSETFPQPLQPSNGSSQAPPLATSHRSYTSGVGFHRPRPAPSPLPVHSSHSSLPQPPIRSSPSPQPTENLLDASESATATPRRPITSTMPKDNSNQLTPSTPTNAEFSSSTPSTPSV